MRLKEGRLVRKSLLAVLALNFLLIMPIVPAYAYNSISDAKVSRNLEGNGPLTIKQKRGSVSSCAAYFENSSHVDDCRIGEVPAPAATWLFIAALIGFVGLSCRRKL